MGTGQLFAAVFVSKTNWSVHSVSFLIGQDSRASPSLMSSRKNTTVNKYSCFSVLTPPGAASVSTSAPGLGADWNGACNNAALTASTKFLSSCKSYQFPWLSVESNGAKSILIGVSCDQAATGKIRKVTKTSAVVTFKSVSLSPSNFKGRVFLQPILLRGLPEKMDHRQWRAG
jgi:hypothetical protein